MFRKNICFPSKEPYFPNGGLQNQSVLEIVRWSRHYKFIKTKVFAGDSSILTKLWQKGGRFPIVICNASSPTCLLWRLLVEFQAPNFSAVHLASSWGAVSPGSQVALPSQGFKALACFQLAWWRVEKPPELAFPAPSAQLLSRPSFYGLWSGSTFPGVDPDTL